MIAHLHRAVHRPADEQLRRMAEQLQALGEEGCAHVQRSLQPQPYFRLVDWLTDTHARMQAVRHRASNDRRASG